MSSGTVHSKASTILCGGFILAGAVLADPTSIQYSIGSLVGVLVTPDLDVDRGFIANRIIRNKVGYVAEYAWNVFWYPYKKSLKHGGPLSHWPVISTLGRFLYMHVGMVVVPMFAWSFLDPGYDWFLKSLEVMLRFVSSYHDVLIGLMASDLIHFCLDEAFTDTSTGKALFGLKMGYNRARPERS